MSTSRQFDAKEVARIANILGVADEVDLEQLRRGMAIELEHGRRDSLTDVTGDEPLITAKIALAHLREIPDYYDRLARMGERAFRRGWRRRMSPRNLLTVGALPGMPIPRGSRP